MKKGKWLSFSAAIKLAKNRPGIYEIRMDRIPLKVGIAGKLLKRLRQHARSSQKCLKSSFPEPWSNPSQVKSTASILAKHLYFDTSFAPIFNLHTEQGRVTFLEQRCKVRFEETRTREAARRKERSLEAIGKYRYLGRVEAR
jgi:hypothetical protein